jgi:hypothetical protein
MVNKSTKGIIKTVLIVILIIILIISLGLIAGLFFGFIDLSLFSNDLLDSSIPESLELPEPKDSCSSYNIPEEFRNSIGSPTINAIQASCNGLSGIWTEEYNEMSCWWNPIVEPDICDSDAEAILENFCEEGLKATWTCNKFDAFIGCLCNENAPGGWIDIEPEPEPEEDTSTACEDVVLPQYGDLGGICREEGNCETNNCEHYWWYNEQEHKCGCTDTTFCGQYCFDYHYTVNCECPPDSYKQLTSRSTFMCIPNGYDTCVDGNPENTGPFPD